MNDIILSTQNGEPVVSSRQIAESFGKNHKDVLESIRTMTAENSALLPMFHPSEYTTSQSGEQEMSFLPSSKTGKERESERMTNNKKPGWKEQISNWARKIDPMTLSCISLGISCFSLGFSLGVLLARLL